jgi:hypothetical protein
VGRGSAGRVSGRSLRGPRHPSTGGDGSVREAGAVFKDILFTVDLEHLASWEKALPVALHEAQASGAQLHVMTGCRRSPYPP